MLQNSVAGLAVVFLLEADWLRELEACFAGSPVRIPAAVEKLSICLAMDSQAIRSIGRNAVDGL